MIRRYTKQSGYLVPLNTLSSPVVVGTQGGINLSTTIVPTTTITASATTHTKGSWTELEASTTSDFSYLEITIYGTALNTADTSTLLDIGIGGSGSEQVLIANIGVGFKVALNIQGGVPETLLFPIKIPSGSRISARAQSVISGKTVEISHRFYSSPFDIGSSGIVTLGANTATSNGVSLTTTSVHNKGAWTQITSSTSDALQGIVLSPQLAPGTTAVSASTYLFIDIGTGSSGSEQVIIENIVFQIGNAESIQRASHCAFYQVDIPAGTRIAARFQRQANNHTVGLTIHGIKA